MSDRKAIAQVKAAMLAAQTLGELHALMEDYSYLEFMQIYNRLTPAQQAKLNAIDEHDCTVQQNRGIPHPQQADFRSVRLSAHAEVRQARMNACRMGRVLRDGVGTEPCKSTNFDIRE